MGEWCFLCPDENHAEGPFPTREAALDAAKRDGSRRVLVGTVERVDPHLYLDLDHLLDLADDNADMDGWGDGEGPVFELAPGATAAFRRWVDEYVPRDAWRMASDYEEVTLG